MITLKGRVTEVARRSDGVMTIAVRGETEVGERKGYWFLGGLENSLGLALDQEVEVMVVPQPSALRQTIADLAQMARPDYREQAVLLGVEDPEEI